MITTNEKHIDNLPDLMNQQQLANYLGKSQAWLERQRWASEPPKYVKIGRNVRYRSADIIEWINSSLVDPSPK
jgi:predicted DNA-binding transcriptional regulator AlpA